ncbi:rhomboid family intramembrane serine protease [Alloiococcus sp. CFN-8]|uniref:rhomboid family intramembrane serine protease n=1 Tax=Alloiococcus sp. CFN-8 TaxID=3416081 RepID=UPI003CE80259
MKWLNKLERKYSRFAIENLMQYVIGITVLVYLLENFMQIDVQSYLYFSPELIKRGEVWRIITFIFMPEFSGLFSLFLASYFYIMIGNTLEYHWGTFRFNLYYLCGIIGIIIAGMITGFGTPTYLNLSLFLAFAYLYPDVEVRLFFLIPIKVKWLAYLDWFYFIITLVNGTWGQRAAVIASLINFFIFFGKDFIDYIQNKRRYGSVQSNFRRQMRQAEKERLKRERMRED